MARLIPAAERILRARKLIQQARDFPVPGGGLGKSDLSYVAGVKDILRQARDMVKFISMTPSATPAIKEDAREVLEAIAQAEHEILERSA